MDAKAKVVAHIVFGKPEDYPPVAIQEYAGSISVIRDRVMANANREGFHGDFVTRMADLGWWLEPLVTLTDHEAAMADLIAERDAWKEFAQHQECCGVCADSVGDCMEGSHLRTLASAGLEGKKGD